jgi:hypothetical protein
MVQVPGGIAVPAAALVAVRTAMRATVLAVLVILVVATQGVVATQDAAVRGATISITATVVETEAVRVVKDAGAMLAMGVMSAVASVIVTTSNPSKAAVVDQPTAIAVAPAGAVTAAQEMPLAVPRARRPASVIPVAARARPRSAAVAELYRVVVGCCLCAVSDNVWHP